MRVLLNTKLLMTSNKAGIGSYVFNLYNELLKAGIDVVPTLSERSFSLVSSIGSVSSRLRATFGKFYPPFVRRVGDAVYRHLYQKDTGVSAYDLYHETDLELMPAIQTRSVCNIYDLSFERFPEFFLKGFPERARTVVSANVAAAERIIVNTRFIKEEVVEMLKVSEEKIDVIPLAASDFYCEGGDSRARPKSLKKITGRDYILYVGTVEPRKNLKTLIRAYKDVRKKFDLALVIAGGFGWLYDDIISYPGELGLGNDVIFTNYVDDDTVRSLYRCASVFVYPSHYEGFGLPPLEAMLCGTPVIIADIPPLREVSGDAAIFFNPADHQGLSYAIERVLSSGSLRREMKQKGIEKASEYSWRKVAADTIRTYEKALNN